MSTVKKILGEDVPAPAGPPIYKIIKAEDIEMSDALSQFLGEATEDGSVAGIGELQYTEDHNPEHAEECARLVALMTQLGADYILL